MMPDNRNLDDSEQERAIKPLPKGENYLLVVGINYDKSKSPFKTLKNAVPDAAAFLNVVLDRYDFSDPRDVKDGAPKEIDTLKTTFFIDPDKKKLNNKFKELSKHLKEEDNLVIYFAGHGDYDASGFYLIPPNGEKDDSETWVNIGRMVDTLTIVDPDTKKQRCRHLLMILDCCYSAGALSGLSSTDVNKDLSRYVIASAVEKATDGRPDEGSPFRLALCELLLENLDPFYNINEGELRKKLQKYNIIQNLKIEQSIRHGRIPSKYDNGTGWFEFELREKNIPPVDLICDTFVKHLNFTNEKDMFRKIVVNGKKNSNIYIINLHEDQHHLSIMKKSLKNTMSRYFRKWPALGKIDIDAKSISNGGIWEYLFQIKQEISEIKNNTHAGIGLNDKKEILSWLLTQVNQDEEPSTTSGMNIVNITMRAKTKNIEIYKKVNEFCKDLTLLCSIIESTKDATVKLFILITEEKVNGEIRFIDSFKENVAIPTEIGFIESTEASPVEKTTVIDWHADSISIIDTEYFTSLIPEDIHDEISKKALGNGEVFSVKYFIEESCKFIFKDAYESKKGIVHSTLFND